MGVVGVVTKWREEGERERRNTLMVRNVVKEFVW